MKFSIITVTYNSRACLATAMQSVLTQDVEELEYLLVDGGSRDGTVELIRNAAERDDRIRWVSEPDDGIADAFNKGLQMASGDWVGILNSDDCYTPGTLRRVAEAIRQHPTAGIIHGDLQRLDEQGRPLFRLKPADLDKAVWHQMPINHPATFVACTVYEQVGGFDTSLPIAMDYDLVLRAYRAGVEFTYIDAILAQMRYGGASDDRLWRGLRDVWTVSVRQGYPRWKASLWLLFRGALGTVKSLLRRTGLSALLMLHPRFRKNR